MRGRCGFLLVLFSLPLSLAQVLHCLVSILLASLSYPFTPASARSKRVCRGAGAGIEGTQGLRGLAPRVGRSSPWEDYSGWGRKG